jgi:hypothetical protein
MVFNTIGSHSYIQTLFLFASVTILGAVVGESIGFFLSTLTINVDVVISVGTVVALLSLILGGFYVKSIPYWLIWLQYLSPLRYTYIAILKIVLANYETILCDSNGFYINQCIGQDAVKYRTVLQWLGTGVLGSTFAPYNILVMLAMFIFFRILAFLSLAFIPIKIGRD